MERVQFHQEQMLAELKDLVQKGLFTQNEVKQIIKKRTAFETALVRRIAEKGDYLRYAAYEMGLEALRKKRLSRLNLPPSPPSVSDYALVRRQFYILERAVRKFKADIALWVEYIQLTKRERARALSGRICARALQLHPSSAPLYILSASLELDQHSPGAARALLQRGLRLNPESIELWTEYVKMELGYIESLRRRWDLLGIKPGDEPIDTADEDSSPLVTSPDKMEEDGNVDRQDSTMAMKEVMGGAIVKTVMGKAVEACSKVVLFKSLRDLLVSYPTPLREALLDELYSLLEIKLPNDPSAIYLHVTRSLHNEQQDDFIDRLKDANNQFASALKSSAVDKDLIGGMYADWVQEWVNKLEDESLRLYLLHSLNNTIASLAPSRLSISLLSTNLKLYISPRHPSPPSPAKILKASRSYLESFPQSTEIWRASLGIAQLHMSPDSKERIWRKAREDARGDVESLQEIWTWGIEHIDKGTPQLWEDIIRSSMRHSSPALHGRLLGLYIAFLYDSTDSEFSTATLRNSRLQRVFSTTLPPPECFQKIFMLESKREDCSHIVLDPVYERWRSVAGQQTEAALAYGEWLLHEQKDGKKAKAVIERARLTVSAEPRMTAELDQRWIRILNSGHGRVTSDESEGSDVDESHIEMEVIA